MPAPKILIIIVTWNKKEYVLNLLHSLEKIDYPKERTDLLVIDNASNDGTKEAVSNSFPHVEIIYNTENLGGSGGFNTGLARAFEASHREYDYLWLLDNDVVVHYEALSGLVGLLESQKDAGVAGSTMMQLDAPWRVNEVGAFIDPRYGGITLHKNGYEIDAWREKEVKELIASPITISEQPGAKSFHEVDYVAAASLLVRADAARKAGLWMDFFLHFDDIEWCLRIKKMGFRILASTRSFIWHLSFVAKAPTWIHYYDNRNPLYMFRRNCRAVYSKKQHIRRILLKGLRQAMMGRPELASLHIDAIDDFTRGITGKKEIRLSPPYQSADELHEVLSALTCRRVLVPWTVWDSPDKNLVRLLREIIEQHPRFEITLLGLTGMDCSLFTNSTPALKVIRLHRAPVLKFFSYVKLFRKFDLAFQSDCALNAGLAFTSKYTLFLNADEFMLRKRDHLNELTPYSKELIKRWL